MFKNLLPITFRSLLRQGIFSFINILGLSIGLAVVVLFCLLNFQERSFDRGIKECNNIYRIVANTDNDTYAAIANAAAPAMREIPEVRNIVRTIKRWYDMVSNDNGVQIEVIWADSAFFNMFDTQFILGRPEDVMSRPSAIAISENEAKRLFGNSDPLGQLLIHTIWRGIPPLEVVAVFKDYPENSSLYKHKIIAPFMYCHETVVHRQVTWIVDEFETFCLLTPNADITTVNMKMQKIVSDAIVDLQGVKWRPQLQRFTDIHLHSKKFAGLTSMNNLEDIGKVRMMTLLSVIILLVACVNYMNLSTARAQKRSKEMGISKTVGAQRTELVGRLTLETAIYTLISFIIAFMIAWALHPLFNQLADVQLNFKLMLQPMFIIVTMLIWVVTTLLAAAYPTLYVSGFPPISSIRSTFTPHSSHAIIREVLTVGQFAVAIILISWVLVIHAQIVFVNNKDLGYNPHNVIGFWIHDSNPTSILDEFRAQSSVEMVSRENRLGNFFGVSENLLFKDPDDQTGFSIIPNAAEPNYFELMQIKFLAGRTYQDVLLRDTFITVPSGETYNVRIPINNYTEIVLNRAAVEYLGMTPEEAIGQKVMAKFSGMYGYPVICGVIENYHYESLHRPIGGVCFYYGLGQHKRFLLLRVTGGNIPKQLKAYEEIYKKYFPNNPLVPEFLDDIVSKQYDSERRTVSIVIVFSILAIFVACMGVFGLTAFMAEQRTREIGIRKVMGANEWNVVSLFAGNYVKLLCISLIIAIPVAWWVGERYLENFAYRISLSWWLFAAATLITVIITLLTVCTLAIKAALANPINSIKVE